MNPRSCQRLAVVRSCTAAGTFFIIFLCLCMIGKNGVSLASLGDRLKPHGVQVPSWTSKNYSAKNACVYIPVYPCVCVPFSRLLDRLTSLAVVREGGRERGREGTRAHLQGGTHMSLAVFYDCGAERFIFPRTDTDRIFKPSFSFP